MRTYAIESLRTFVTMKDPKGYLKPDQIHPIIEASPYPFNLCFLVAWNTGRRISEIVSSKDVLNSVGIRRMDLDMLNNRIRFVTLKKRITENKKKIDPKKYPSHTYMWVDGIDSTLITKLWELSETKSEKEPIFNFGRKVATIRFRRICEKIGIRRIGATYPHMHHLRHSAIMFMYVKGMRPEQIQMRTGHGDINSLLYYIKVLELENLTEKFKELWKSESEWIKGVLK